MFPILPWFINSRCFRNVEYRPPPRIMANQIKLDDLNGSDWSGPKRAAQAAAVAVRKLVADIVDQWVALYCIWRVLVMD